MRVKILEEGDRTPEEVIELIRGFIFEKNFKKIEELLKTERVLQDRRIRRDIFEAEDIYGNTLLHEAAYTKNVAVFSIIMKNTPTKIQRQKNKTRETPANIIGKMGFFKVKVLENEEKLESIKKNINKLICKAITYLYHKGWKQISFTYCDDEGRPDLIYMFAPHVNIENFEKMDGEMVDEYDFDYFDKFLCGLTNEEDFYDINFYFGR